ncbi:hypothetical protein SSX86_015354 [Deinandra increscens subsp. villosa]|uniref:BZIP domain-containing protein n=1 Tax=Deinandra increscens subsp. villosa TaxID=3103831 RepID=A0AAP0GZ62_9ASTR
MTTPYEQTLDGNGNSSPTVDEPSPLPPTQVSNVCSSSTAGAKSMSIAALDAAIEHEIRMGRLDPNMDKKHMRRIISNRYAAKKAHDRKVNKMIELENSKKDLEDTIAILRPRIEQEQQLKSHLSHENAILVKQLQIHADLNKLKDEQIYKNTMERERLKGLLGMHPPPPPYN